MKAVLEMFAACMLTGLVIIMIVSMIAGISDGASKIHTCNYEIRAAKYNPLYLGTCEVTKWLVQPIRD